MPRGKAAPSPSPTAALRTPHLVALLVVAHAPLMMMWAVVPTAFSAGEMVAAPLVFGLAGLILLGYVLGYSGLGRRIRHSGGLYVQVTAGLGRKAGLGTAALIFVSYLGIAAGIYGLLSRILQAVIAALFSVDLSGRVCLFLGLALVLLATRLSLLTVVRIAMVVAVEQFFAVLLFDFSALRSPAGGHVSFDSLDPGWLLSGSFAVTLVFAISAFIGSEVTTVYSTELADPAQSVPRATYLSYGVTTLILVLTAWAVSVTVGPEITPATAQAQEGVFMPAIVGRLAGGGSWSVNLLLVNLVIGIVVTAVTVNNATARQLAGLARDRVLPRALAVRRPGGAPPTPATLVQPVIAGILAFLGSFTVTGVVPQWMIVAAGLGVIGSLALASGATAVWFLRGEADEGGFFGWEGQVIAGLISVVTTGGVFLYGVLRIHDVVRGAPPAASWLVGTVLVLVFAAGVAGALVLQSTRPEAYAAIGKGLLSPAGEIPAEDAPPALIPHPRRPTPDYPAQDASPGPQYVPPGPQYAPPAGVFEPQPGRDDADPRAGAYHRPGQTRHRER